MVILYNSYTMVEATPTLSGTCATDIIKIGIYSHVQKRLLGLEGQNVNTKVMRYLLQFPVCKLPSTNMSASCGEFTYLHTLLHGDRCSYMQGGMWLLCA